MSAPKNIVDKDVVRFTGTGEWSALYVDGKIDTYGDHYVVNERIAALFGVLDAQSNDFVRPVPGSHREVVYDTVEEVYAVAEQRAHALEEAARLRAEAESLIRQAKQLEDN